MMISSYKPVLGLLLTAIVSLVSLYFINSKQSTNHFTEQEFLLSSHDVNPQNLLQYTDEAQKDFITSLPGLNFYYSSSFAQFSGFLTVDEAHGRNIHYWYVESTRDPDNDPVILWTNGGPGCSGLLGFGTEFGPFRFNRDGSLSLNPFTWNSIANIVYIEQPAGVGFSYSNQPESDYVTGDPQAAVDNFKVIQEFFKRFPQRKNNDFYIASESFGGHYIPQLALEIMDRNVDGAIRFRGFLVGNPYVDPFSNDVTMMQTYYMHGLFAKPVYDHWKSMCADKATYDAEVSDIVG
jgi:carboxypeptidase C (cathepsin A)